MGEAQEIISLRKNYQRHLGDEFQKYLLKGCRRFDLLGGRRSGKTYFALQFLLGQMAQGAVVSVATMTDTQGRLGAYQDACDIIAGSPDLAGCIISKTPLEIKHPDGGRMFFKSYLVSERAKGIACDWLYINEANNFTEQQYIDLAASVREGVIADRNPNTECWTERNGFTMIHSTWQDNRKNLTPEQVQWFEDLKRKAEAPNATSADVAFYRMYYLGEYAEITGKIFTPANIRRERIDLQGLTNWFIYADPSSMCGADYFAMVLVAAREGVMYVVDVWSRNVGSRIDVAEQMNKWCVKYGVREVFVEANGLTGKNFYEEQRSSLPLRPYNNKDSKHGRILGNYEAICSRVVFNNDAPDMATFLAQVYAYEGRERQNVNDDNIDAVNSAYEIMHRRYRGV